MGDVGDVDLQFEVAVVQMLHRHGVVEIARGFAVDGDDGQVAKIASPLQFRPGIDGSACLCFFEDSRRETVRQMVLADDDLDVHAEIVFIAENFDYSSTRILRGCGPIGDFNVHNDIFQVVPGRAARRFFAQHAMRTLSTHG